MASQLTQTLGGTSRRDDATELKEQESTESALFYAIFVLGSKDQPLHVRHQASITIKNVLSIAQSESTTNTFQQRWRALPDAAKTAVKGMILQILADEQKDVRKTAALVVGKIAAVEIPEEKWNDLIPSLVKGIKQKENLGLRQSSLEALGYVCEVPGSLGAQANSILDAFTAGMDPSEQNKDISFVRRLFCCFSSPKTNMDNQNDRNTIMNPVPASQSSIPTPPAAEVPLSQLPDPHPIADPAIPMLPMPYMGLNSDHTPTTPIKIAAESTSSSSSLPTCPICALQIAENELYQMQACRHAFHLRCIRFSYKTQESRVQQPFCPVDNCHQTITHSPQRRLLPPIREESITAEQSTPPLTSVAHFDSLSQQYVRSRTASAAHSSQNDPSQPTSEEAKSQRISASSASHQTILSNIPSLQSLPSSHHSSEPSEEQKAIGP